MYFSRDTETCCCPYMFWCYFPIAMYVKLTPIQPLVLKLVKIMSTNEYAFIFTASCVQLTAFIAAADDAALTASDVYPNDLRSYGPTHSRLFTNFVENDHIAGWSAADDLYRNKYIQVRTHTRTH